MKNYDTFSAGPGRNGYRRWGKMYKKSLRVKTVSHLLSRIVDQGKLKMNYRKWGR